MKRVLVAVLFASLVASTPAKAELSPIAERACLAAVAEQTGLDPSKLSTIEVLVAAIPFQRPLA